MEHADAVDASRLPATARVDDITPSLAGALSAIAKRYQLDAIYVFGSRADEIAARVAGRPVDVLHPASDIDIGVLPARGACTDPWERGGLVADLESVFEPSRVDVVILPEAPPFLALEVIRGERICVMNPDAEAHYELYVLRRAGDLAHFEKARRAALLGREVPW